MTRNERKRKAAKNRKQWVDAAIQGSKVLAKKALVKGNEEKIRVFGTLSSDKCTIDKTGGLIMPEYGYSSVNVVDTNRLRGSMSGLRKGNKPLTAR